MHVLLVQPAYYTCYPPLGLLKLATYHQLQCHTVELVQGCQPVVSKPDQIHVTSLFTYAWEPVHQAIAYYKRLFPQVRLTVGGIYATLMPEHAKSSQADEVFTGIDEQVEDLLPDYSLVPSWEPSSIVFSHRGCIRKCPFCAVPSMERHIVAKRSIRHRTY